MFVIATLLAGLAEPKVIEILEGDAFVRRGIVAELIERPSGVSDEQFAQQLIDAEGLKPWSGQQMNFPAVDGGMAVKAVVSGDGREVSVRYLPSDASQVGKVCRVRLSRGGASDERSKAYRWCAEAFGLTLPEKAPPPIRVQEALR